MKEPRFSAHSALLPMMVLLLEFISTAVALRAQAPLQFNVPYQCPNGITYIIYRCENRPKGEVCFYKAGQNGQWDSDAYTSGPQMADRVKGCSVSAPSTAPNTNTQPTNPPFIREFPSVERVKAEMRGTDPMDTAARQMGAFWQLQEIIKEMSGLRWMRSQLTPDEKRVIGQYAAGYQAAEQPYASYPDRPKWYKKHAFYEVDDGFREELFQRFLSPGVRDQWGQIKGETRATLDARRQAREQAARGEQTGGGGQQDAQAGLQALQQLAQGLSQVILSAASSLPATQPGAAGYATAVSAEEAKEQWERVLSKSDTFESKDEFTLMFLASRPGYAGMMCHGSLLLGQRPYTVETRNGRVVLSFFKGENAQTWMLGLRQDGALVSLNARTLQLFGKEESKHKPCGVDVLTPKPRAVTSASAATGTKPSQPGAAAATTAEAAYASGKKYYEAKDYPKAVEAYKKAIALKPSWAQAHYGLGMTYVAQEKRQEALEVADKLEPLDQKLYEDLSTECIAIDPVFNKVLGDKFLNEKNPEKALVYFREAVRLGPDYAEAREGLGKAYFILKQYPNALAALKEAVRLKPDFAEAHFGLGMTYLAMGNKNAALQVYNTLQRIDKGLAQKLYNSINK